MRLDELGASIHLAKGKTINHYRGVPCGAKGTVWSTHREKNVTCPECKWELAMRNANNIFADTVKSWYGSQPKSVAEHFQNVTGICPADVTFLLWCHTRPQPHPDIETPTMQRAICRLFDRGLIEIDLYKSEKANHWTTTTKGRQLVTKLCAVTNG